MERKDIKTYTVSQADLEKMLDSQFGSKLEPVNETRLAKQKRDRARRNNIFKAAGGVKASGN